MTRKQLKAIETQATRVASLATFNNPVSILLLSRVQAVAKEALLKGLTEEAAVQKTRIFIAELNGAR